MGQKVNPNGMRLGIVRDWDAVWYEENKYADFLADDRSVEGLCRAGR